MPSAPDSLLYAYFVVGLIAAALMPEVYFYSSGGVEERWTPKDLNVNRLNVVIGYGIGGLLAFALMMVAAQLLKPAGVDPDSLGTVALQAELSFGQTGLLLALGGILFAVGGAAIDACFSGAYNLSRLLGWEWGKYRGVRQAPRFTVAWLVFIALAAVVVLTGIDPIGQPPRAVALLVGSGVLETLLIGRGGLARRLGVGRGRVTEVPVRDIVRIGDGEIVVRRQAPS